MDEHRSRSNQNPGGDSEVNTRGAGKVGAALLHTIWDGLKSPVPIKTLPRESQTSSDS